MTGPARTRPGLRRGHPDQSRPGHPTSSPGRPHVVELGQARVDDPGEGQCRAVAAVRRTSRPRHSCRAPPVPPSRRGSRSPAGVEQRDAGRRPDPGCRTTRLAEQAPGPAGPRTRLEPVPGHRPRQSEHGLPAARPRSDDEVRRSEPDRWPRGCGSGEQRQRRTRRNASSSAAMTRSPPRRSSSPCSAVFAEGEDQLRRHRESGRRDHQVDSSGRTPSAAAGARISQAIVPSRAPPRRALPGSATAAAGSRRGARK